MPEILDKMISVRKAIEDLKAVSIEKDGMIVIVDLSPGMMYAYGYAAGVTESLVNTATNEEELKKAGLASLMVIEATIHQGAGVLTKPPETPPGYQ